jgi:Fe-S-cluster containining protein
MSDFFPCTLQLGWAGHAARFDLRVPKRRLRLSELVLTAEHVTHVVVEQAVKGEAAEGRALSCRAGCGACCRQLVPVSGPEAFRLAEHIVSLPESERDRWIERFEHAERRLAESDLLPRLQALMAHGPAHSDLSALARDYFALGLPCPLLVDESCGLHPARPLSCRDFNVTTPAEWCAEPRAHPVRKVPTPPLLSAPLARTMARLTKTEPALIPLALALGWVEAHAELGYATWPGERLLRTLVREIERAP